MSALPAESAALAQAARAFADRSYETAAGLYRSALTNREGINRAAVLLDLARSLDRAGSVLAAWQCCQEAADLARSAGDGRMLADAATAIRAVGDTEMAAQVHELCVEALAALDPTEQSRQDQVRAVLTATASRWARPVQPTTGDADDAESRFRELQASHAERLGVEFLHDRLDIADRAVSLGRRVGSAEYTAWGLAWRIDALSQLGDRIAVDAELAVLTQVADRLAEPLWSARLLRIRAMLAFADGRPEDSRRLTDQALACCPDEPWVQFLHLVLTADLAEWTGDGLTAVEPLVRTAIERAPFFARGWLAQILVALGWTDEATVLWRAIAPHVAELPKGALESMVAQAGHARLCVALGDREHAAAVYQELAPFGTLWVCGMADAPNEGPVALHLGRLSLLMGNLDEAAVQVTIALRMAESSHVLPFVADAHLALAEIATVRAGLPNGLDQAEVVLREARLALDRANQMGLKPLAAKAQTLLTAHRRRRATVLTEREEHIVSLLTSGLSNRIIAQQLHLSERTVENHVSHVLNKTGHSSRAGVAAWYARLGDSPDLAREQTGGRTGD